MKREIKKENNTAEDQRERLNITGEAPITPYRIAEMVVCFAAIVVGMLYFYTSFIPLRVMMPLFTACFIVITALKILDMRKTGVKKFSSVVLTAVLGVLALLMTATTVFYFTR